MDVWYVCGGGDKESVHSLNTGAQGIFSPPHTENWRGYMVTAITFRATDRRGKTVMDRGSTAIADCTTLEKYSACKLLNQ
jgi:hypothetical protein